MPRRGPSIPSKSRLLENQATLTIDTTGPGLHKRGYRRLVGKAPLKETLAAALVLLSFWKPERPLVDPFCGTGTIPIEAALIGRNMAPGLSRTFAAEAWPAVPAALWEAARQEARQAIAARSAPAHHRHRPGRRGLAIGPPPCPAGRRGRGRSTFSAAASPSCTATRPTAASSAIRPTASGWAGPPKSQALYRDMPEVFRRLKTWSFYVLTAHPDFEALLGQEADRRRKLYNGRIECTYYQFFGPKPRDAQRPRTGVGAGARRGAKPAFGGLSAKAREQAEIFRSRLAKRARHLRRWPTPLGHHLLPALRARHPRGAAGGRSLRRLPAHCRVRAAPRAHARRARRLARPDEADRRRGAGDSGGERLSQAARAPARPGAVPARRRGKAAPQIVAEGGLRFEINLSDYIDTGLFLDHRITRGMIREAAAGKRFLNLFAYTGSFTVYAAAGGAASTVTVDLSATHLDWAGRNMALNDLPGAQHQFVRDDALSFLRSCPPGAQFDLAVVDPPTFSNSKRLDEFWDIQRDHAELLGLLMERMSPGGVHLLFHEFPPFQAGGRGACRRDDPRDQPADGAARLSQPPYPSLLADGAKRIRASNVP